MKNPLDFKIISFDEKIERASFDCREEALNDYKKTKNNKKNWKTLLIDSKSLADIKVSMAEIFYENLPEQSRKKLPRYPLPAMRIGRLAVDIKYQGLGLGGRLLVDALRRAINLFDDIGIYSVLVDAKNESAVHFYEHYGFIRFSDRSNTLFLPIETILKAL
ncbi:MAG: GNAT family N-acetyltransferase [Leptospiraceae bacterium]|nr:GNAT family N-acetyltransferase [Leptospiraceae bacterium]